MLEEKENIKISNANKNTIKSKPRIDKESAAKLKKPKESTVFVAGSSIETREATKRKKICLVCLGVYDEDWIQVCNCKEWAHEVCADISECFDQYICVHSKIS